MVSRIQLILKKKNLSPSQLADEIHIQRSSISHILSERNKPSLDFVMKVLERFPEIDSDWLIFGKGQMMNSISQSKIEVEKKNIIAEKKIEEKEEKIETAPTSSSLPLFDEKKKEAGNDSSEIVKIVIFYKDNTFKEYTSK